LDSAITRIESWFARAGRAKSLGLGILISAIIASSGLVIGLKNAVIVSFVTYFPIHGWLTISLFLVTFSSYERERMLGPGYSAIAGSHARFISPFGLFCMGWFFTLVVVALASGVAK
jgi:hypothetical protein